MGQLTHLKIDHTDVYLHDYETGKGKITISDTYHGSFSSYWGAMGGNLTEFIQRINSEYFAQNLTCNAHVFCPKKSVKELRGYIRNYMKDCLPWYKFPSAQKEMRLCIRGLEKCGTEHEFVDVMQRIPNSLFCDELTTEEEEEFKSIINELFTCEPWHFIGRKPSQSYVFLQDFHEKLKNQLIQQQ